MGPTKYGYWFPPNIGGQNATDVDQLIDVMHWAMLLLFVGWGVFFVYTIIKFRARSGRKADYQQVKAKPSKWLELAVVAFEAVVLLGFSMPVWARVRAQIPTGPNVLDVRLVAEQFNWNFHYPGADGKFGRTAAQFISATNKLGLDPDDTGGKDDIWSLNQLHIPVDTDVVISGTSKDVIHSLWIPVLRVKQDLIPGMRFRIWAKGTQTTDELRVALARPYALDEAFEQKMLLLICQQDYSDAAGLIVGKADAAGKGGRFNEDVLKRLRAAGLREVLAAPSNPAEVACAQLCGNLHYQMRGYLTIETREKFDAWLKEMAPAAGDGEWE